MPKISAARRAFQAGFVALLFAIVATQAAPVSPPDYEVELREAWVTMPDGVRLAVDLYTPAGAAKDDKFPVVFEYEPYRKDESRNGRYFLFAYLVRRGYIVARADIRGTGRSEGRLVPYEYSDQELDDGGQIIDWLSKLPGSNGKVAMMGISWGGFSAIQLASRNPPALKAIVALDSTEDLYQDDVHYMDGIIHFDSWAMSQDLANALPASPDYVIDAQYFENRFDTEPWTLTYLQQQRDGPFWDRASARDKYEQFRVPSLLIGGWYDGYRDSVPRMLANVPAPVKAIVGAWSHAWPNDPYPKPGFEWRHELVRWFDYWLKGMDTGIMDEPRLAVYVRDWHPPGPYLDFAPGRWRYEDAWPIGRIQSQAFYPQPNHSLRRVAAKETQHELRYVATSGAEAGGPVMWWGDVAHDQRPSDAFAMVYDSEPVEDEIEILGLPRALLRVAADAPQANWFVRLSDVAPDGSVTLVTGAGFNGTHRNSARAPEAIEPGEIFDLDIELHFTSWVFAKGHRIRIAVSNAQWPMLWPTPYPMSTTLYLGGKQGSRVELPVVPPGRERVPEFRPIEASEYLPGYESLDDGTVSGFGELQLVEHNLQTGEAKAVATNHSVHRYPWATETVDERIEHWTSELHPERTGVSGRHAIEIQVGDRKILLEGETKVSSDAGNFYYEYSRRLSENGNQLRYRTWSKSIPRDYQ